MVCWTKLQRRFETIRRVPFNSLFRPPSNFLAFGFGVGLSPIAPGTLGSLVALPLVWLLKDTTDLVYLSLALVLFLAGVRICSVAAKSLGVHDHPGIVWDEIVGILLVFMLVPVTATTLIAGFLLFRFFDIVKPWPISKLDSNVHGGLGIMVDDVAAGLASAILLWLGWLVVGTP